MRLETVHGHYRILQRRRPIHPTRPAYVFRPARQVQGVQSSPALRARSVSWAPRPPLLPRPRKRLLGAKPSHLLAALALATACEGSQPSASPPGRVVSVKAGAKKQVSLEEFCDVTGDKTNKGAFRLPEMDGSLAPPPADGARWVNVWATWCKPCIEEMPMLVKWKERLGKQGIIVNLQFLSVDQSVEEMEAFRKKYPRLPPSLHLKNPDALQPWMQQLGLDQGAGLPIHVFVDARGRVRCVRAASLSENDYDMVAGLIKGTV